MPSEYCVNSKFTYGGVEEKPLGLYRGEDCVEKFCEYVLNEPKRLYDMFPSKSMKKLTSEQWRDYNTAEKCHICMKPFEEEEKKSENADGKEEYNKSKKVRDYCHYTGDYRGAAHNGCNLRYKIPSYIPVVFHNLSGYDAHLFIRELGRQNGNDSIGVIAENKKKYISFNVDVKVGEYTTKDGKTKDKKIQLRFIDSVRFMASSLDRLTSNLLGAGGSNCKCGSPCEFINIDENYGAHSKCKECGTINIRKLDKEAIRNNFSSLVSICYDDEYEFDDEMFRLLLRKGVYPYEYMDDFDRFNETKLPSIESFDSKLNMSSISKVDYQHAENVWNKFGIGNLGEYHDLYLELMYFYCVVFLNRSETLVWIITN